MKYLRHLIVVNLVLGLGLSIFTYVMLPFANSEANWGHIIRGEKYAPLGPLEHYGTSLAPLLIISAVVTIALLLRSRAPRVSMSFLLGPLLLVLAWLVIVLKK